MNLCACPAATTLTTIPAATCSETFGQIQKAAFCRLAKADGTKNSFTTGSSTGIDKLAAWTAKMAKTDGEKVVISPYIQAPTQEAGAARTFGGGNETLGGVEIVITPYIQAPTQEAGSPRTFGGGNETLGGVEIIIGREPSTFTGVLRAVPQDIIKAMKALQCEAQADNLGVFLFDENGNIEAIEDATTAGTYYPIPIRSLFIGDKSHGGLEAPDNNAIQWSFLPNYSDDLKIVAPSDFNPLNDLVPAT